jgi:hypothetical protein
VLKDTCAVTRFLLSEYNKFEAPSYTQTPVYELVDLTFGFD